MNNNNEDQGQRNAATLMRILERRRAAQVPHLVARERPAAASAPSAAPATLVDDEAIAQAEWATAPG